MAGPAGSGSFSTGRSGSGTGPASSGAFGDGGGLGAPGSVKVTKDKGKSVLGFANNVVDSTQNALGAVIPGIKLGAESVAHDMFPGGLDSFNPFNKESYKEGMGNTFSVKTWKDELNRLKTGEVATKLVVPAAKSYKQRYTDGFWNNLYNDPIPFVLDLFTVAGVGVNTAAKVGASLERAGKISSTSKLAQLSKPSEIEFSVNGVDKVTKFTSNRPTTRAAQKAWNKTLMTLPPETRWLGEYARAGVLVRKGTDVDAIRNQLVATEYLNAMSRLNKTERVALAILQEVPTRELLEGWKRVITEQGDGGPSNLDQLNDPKVMALFDTPNEKMLNVHRLAGELGDANVKLQQKNGLFHEALADDRRFLGARVASGAEFLTPDVIATQADLLRRNADEEIANLRGRYANSDAPSPAMVEARAYVQRLERLVAKAEEKVGKQRYTRSDLNRIGSVAIDPDLEIRLQEQLDALNKQITDARPKPPVVGDEVRALREQRVLHKRLLRFAAGLEKIGREYSDEARKLGVGGDVPDGPPVPKATVSAPRMDSLRVEMEAAIQFHAKINEVLDAARVLDAPPKSNAALLTKIAALSDDMKTLVDDYRGIRRDDFDNGPDGTDDFRSEREGAWDEITNGLDELDAEQADVVTEAQVATKDAELPDELVGPRDEALVTVTGPAEIQAKIEELTFMIHALGGKIPMVRFPELEKAAKELRAQLKAVRKNPLSTQMGNRIITADGGIASPIGTARLGQLGASLGIARERLQTMEKRAADRAMPQDVRDRITAREARLEEEINNLESGLVGGMSIHELRKHIEEQGRPQPVYRPHQSVPERVSGRGTGGRALPVKPPGVRRNDAVLFQLGRLALDVDLLGPAYMRTVKYALYTDRHNLLLSHAVPQDHLPAGYVLVRRSRGEKMSYRDRTQDQFQEDLRNSIDGDKPPVDMDLTTTRLDDAEVDSEGRYMVVPKSFADNVVGEFGRSYSVPNRFFQSSMTVWRALVLGLRPAWLINNIIGNHLLAAIRFAGIDGLRAYLNAIYNTKGAAAVRRMLGMQDMPRGLSQQFMREFFPEQIHGTFIGTQMPDVSLKIPFTDNLRINNIGKKASIGLAPLDRASEGMLRRTSVETALRKSPEVRAQANKMMGETRTFEEIARDAIMSNRGVAERASAEVNAALGDFLTLGQFEKNFVRQIIPFYAWFKAITKVTLRLPVDMPIRANLLANLSALGAASTEEQFGSPLPNYLKSGVSMGKNRLFRTGGMNPFSTVAQLMSAGRSALPGGDTQNTRDLIGLFNPFLAEAQTVLDPFSPPKFGTIAQIPFDVLRNTPQARILFPRDSKLYEDSARKRAILGYFGAPMGDINRSKAAKDAADGK